jgi:Domain of unknown function (DUF6745)
MGGTRRPEGADLLRRMEAWGDEWRAVAGSTERADRARAEAAIGSLYAAEGRPVPAFAWVPSPAAGALAYAFAARSHRGIISPWARGDVGNGENRSFNGLADPFGMEPAWTYRLSCSVRDRIPPSRLPRRAATDPVAGAAEALGFGGTARVLPAVRSEVLRSSRELLPVGQADPAAVDAAAGVLGEAWPRLVEQLGADLARGIFADATRRLAESLLDPVNGRRDAMQAMQPGQWDVRSPVLAASRDVFGGFIWRQLDGRQAHEHQIEARLEIARSAGPWWALDGLAIVSERPLVLHRDDRGRPHAPDGPAIAWPDGLEAFVWHGIPVDRWVIEDPGRITVESIDGERNAERRRVLVERFGDERLVREGGAELVAEDEVGRLWLRRLGESRPWLRTPEPIVMVEVRNSTPEPDGSRKIYYLRVPPTMRTPREAVAWTFGLGAVDYRPEHET